MALLQKGNDVIISNFDPFDKVILYFDPISLLSIGMENESFWNSLILVSWVVTIKLLRA